MQTSTNQPYIAGRLRSACSCKESDTPVVPGKVEQTRLAAWKAQLSVSPRGLMHCCLRYHANKQLIDRAPADCSNWPDAARQIRPVPRVPNQAPTVRSRASGDHRPLNQVATLWILLEG